MPPQATLLHLMSTRIFYSSPPQNETVPLNHTIHLQPQQDHWFWHERIKSNHNKLQQHLSASPDLDKKDWETSVSVLPLAVYMRSVDGGFENEGIWTDRFLRRCFGTGVWFTTLIIPHGFHITAAAHPPTWDLLILFNSRVTTPLILRHLRTKKTRISQIRAMTFVTNRDAGDYGIG